MTSHQTHPALVGTLRALAELTKPGITTMVMATAAVGFVAGASWCHAAIATGRGVLAVLAVGLVAAGAATVNMVLERHIDARMARTRRRPIPSGRISPRTATVWGLVLTASGIALLASRFGPWATVVASLTWITYLFVYTPLKTMTPFATFVGAVPGAAPPLIGWAAACDQLALPALALFALLFVWQIPHFNAIAWVYREDYARGGLRVLAVVDPTGRRSTGQALWTSIVLFSAGLGPTLVGLTGWLASGVALTLGAAIVAVAWRFRRDPSASAARALFLTSLPYLAIVFATIAVDRL